MQNFSRGQKIPLSQLTSSQELTVTLVFQNPQNLTLDATLFGVDA
ncbi:hypothetical protein [Deinococcus roseus]|uniref:Uncharacterized protein n=1 Tax=Deinococcus roseus TaxID=392414 RepID=A0ABQ2CZP2_9DEIO|nr:hypothetical protein [Deinococcus roseus]GGJ36934.1 hypothetical protein GCM10008938_23720 [Deinococcus roseus]